MNIENMSISKYTYSRYFPPLQFCSVFLGMNQISPSIGIQKLLAYEVVLRSLK